MDDLRADLNAGEIAIPYRVFMYTFDQVAWMLNLNEAYMKQHLVHYEHRSYGAHKPTTFKAVNLALPDEKPMWRISEDELLRWCRHRKIKIKAERRPIR